jgi:predicted histone-like DNA-binding protein
MPVPYVIKKKALPPNSGEWQGKSLYYALPVSRGTLGLVDLTKMIEKMSTVNGADIRAVTYALMEAIITGLSDGMIIKLGELGSFRLSFSSEGKVSPQLVKPSTIKENRVIFGPGEAMKQALKEIKYVKAE